MEERHNLLRHFMCFAVLYFYYDTFSMFIVFRQQRRDRAIQLNPKNGPQNGVDREMPQQHQEDTYEILKDFCHERTLMLAHHLVLPTTLFPLFMTLDTAMGDCLLCVGFLMEASTPFVSARKIMSVFGEALNDS